MGAKKGQKHFQIFAITMAHFLILCGFLYMYFILNHLFIPVAGSHFYSKNPYDTGFLLFFCAINLASGQRACINGHLPGKYSERHVCRELYASRKRGRFQGKRILIQQIGV